MTKTKAKFAVKISTESEGVQPLDTNRTERDQRGYGH